MSTDNTDSPAGIADDQIEELLRLEAEATPGPCNCGHAPHNPGHCMHETCPAFEDGNSYEPAEYCDCGKVRLQAKVDFWKASAAAASKLIARLKHAEAERDRLREALEPFAKLYEKHKYNNDGCLCPAYVSMSQVRAAAEALNPGSTKNERRTSITVEDIRRAAAALADKGVEQ